MARAACGPLAGEHHILLALSAVLLLTGRSSFWRFTTGSHNAQRRLCETVQSYCAHVEQASFPLLHLLRGIMCGCRTAEQKIVKNWDDASCIMQKECRPHLIGIKESTLVS